MRDSPFVFPTDIVMDFRETCSRKANADCPPSILLRPWEHRAPRDSVIRAQSVHGEIALGFISVKPCNTWEMHSHPALVGHGVLKRRCGRLHNLHQLLRHRSGHQSTHHISCHDSSHTPFWFGERCHASQLDRRLDGLWHLPPREQLRNGKEHPEVTTMIEQRVQELDGHP